MPNYPVARRMREVKSSAIRDLLKYAQQPGMISLAGGLPSPALFDIAGLKAATDAAFATQAVAALQYGTTDGMPGLRQEIVNLMATRGATVAAEHVVVTTGSQQGIDLLARMLVDQGDTIVVERPAYLAALQTFALGGAKFETIDIDAEGGRVEELEAIIARTKPKLIYVVATFANPSGATMSLARRKRLIELAVKHEILVVEDDPYGELRSRGSPLPPLIALAKDIPGGSNWVGYLSTLSKILAPGFRVGWLVLPPKLHDFAVIAKQGMDLHTSTFTQAVADQYLRTGRLHAQMPSIRAAYKERNEALADAIHHYLDGAIRYVQPDGGMFLWARFIEAIDTHALLANAIKENMIFVPGTTFYAQNVDTQTLRLSFATPTPDQLREGIARLAKALEVTRRQAVAEPVETVSA
jgi:2-aminoadipate transaminase